MASSTAEVQGSVPPTLDIDPFSNEVLANPYEFHHALREAGPVVTLSAYGIYAVGRYDEVKSVVSDFETYTSTGGMGMSDIRKPGAWRTRSPISEIDPPDHTKVRAALTKIISPLVIRGWRESFQKEAEAVAERVLEQGTIDGAHDVAEDFVLTVFPRALGVNVPKENLVAIGEMNFNQLGPNNELLAACLAKVEQILPWYDQSFLRQNMLPGGFGEKIFLAEDAGELDPGTAALHVRGFLRGGVDTTIAGIGHTLHYLARNPDQWAKIKEDPTKVRGAFEEAIRLESPAQILFRTTTRDTTIGDYRLAADTKVAVCYASANRDPRKWVDADRFDIDRTTAGIHLAFGNGPHVCIGQMIARLEAECLLGAIAKRARSIELVGEPSYRLINTLRTLGKLPLRIVPN